MRATVTIFFLGLLMTSVTVSAAEPHRSVDALVTSNGFGVGHYSLREKKLKTFFPHIYRQYDEGEPIVPNWMYDAYFGIRRGDATWFDEVDVTEARYLPKTGIIEVTQELMVDDESGTKTPISARQYVYFPFSVDAPAEVMLLELTNDSGRDIGGFALFSLHNFHIGSGEQSTSDEAFERLSGRGYVEHGRDGLRAYFRSIGEPDGYAYGSGDSSPWKVMKDFGDFTDTSTGLQPAGDDLAAGFQFNFPDGLADGESVWVGVVMAGTEDGDADALVQEIDDWLADRSAEALLTDARAEWDAWSSVGDDFVPEGLSEDERNVWWQSLAMMRMGQVREPNGPDGSGHNPHGALLAALPKAHPADGEGIWNMSWPRDASYAIAGLSRAGFADEARRGLKFMLDADAGEYEEYVGYDYKISVCRYYGRGREESDWNDDGPNIEFDDFGLFLMALGEQIDSPRNEDRDWWKEYWPVIRDEIAGTLVKLHEDDTRLIAPDSSIWERHWNGNQKHFTYTSVMAAKGLCVAARLAEEMGEPEKAAEFRETVAQLRSGIRELLVDSNGVLVGSLEEFDRGDGYLDAAAVEAFNFGVLPADGPVAKATLDRWREGLYDGDGSGNGGYWRNDDGGWYDRQEWVVIDLRMAIALGYAGRTQQRDDLLDWVVEQTLANYGIMGELYCRGDVDCPTRGDYRGSVPMIGFGPGAYVLAMTERQRGDRQPAICADPADQQDGTSGDVGSGDVGLDGGDVDAAAPGAPVSSDEACLCAQPAAPKRISWFALAVAAFGFLFGTRRWR